MKTIYLLFNTGPYVRAIPFDSPVYERALESIDERERILVTDLPEGWRDCIVRDGKLILPLDDVLQQREAIRERKILQNEQETLRRALAATDYQAIKFAEGELSAEAYRAIKKQRTEARARINEIDMAITGQQPEQLTVLIEKEGILTATHQLGQRDKLTCEMQSVDGSWAILPTAELPKDFSPATYSLETGTLQLAPEPLLAIRQKRTEWAKLRAEHRALKRQLSQTDIEAIKYAEGALTKTAFAPIKKQRAALRARCNELQSLLSTDLNVAVKE